MYSQNGWPASLTSRNMIPLEWITGRVAPETHAVFDAFCRAYNDTVEPIRKDWSWGYAYRSVRGTTRDLSNHASGTAIDLNAPRHPLGVSGTFTSAQRYALRALLARFPVIRWGGDYAGRKDEMHFEIIASPSEVRAFSKRLAVQAIPDAPAQHFQDERYDNMEHFTFFFINGVHHVVDNIAGKWARIPADQVNNFRIWVERRGMNWAWHSDTKGSREIKPADLAFVARHGEFTWGKD